MDGDRMKNKTQFIGMEGDLMKNKAQVITELNNALTFLGQAQELAEPQSPLWKELGKQYDEVDNILEAVKDDCY